MGAQSKIITTACIIVVACLGLLLPAFSAGQKKEAGRGAEMIQLEAGRQPQVLFPHHLHQQKTNNCSVCHQSFPQKRGAINALQEKGELAKQEVMNEICLACHRAKMQAGEPGGPLSCSKCHAR
ncbi:MAG: cytochrome c3 family protein [Desulfosalsimonadaceae bacterium]